MHWLRHITSNVSFVALFILCTSTPAQSEEPEAGVTSAGDAPPAHITWQSPPNCPSPDAQLATLLDTSETHPVWHPLWGTVTVTQDGPSWRAQLSIQDAPSPTTPPKTPTPTPATTLPSTLQRSIEGATCEEVTEAALLVLSLLQREREPPLAALDPEPPPVDVLPTEPPPEASATELNAQPASLDAGTTNKQETASSPATQGRRESRDARTANVTVGAALAGGLWNVSTPSLGAVLSAGYHLSWLTVRAHAGWLTSAPSLPTRESARVHWSAYEAGLRLCATLISGLSACAGPTLQHLTVEGRRVETPTRSAAWFPGFAAALHGAMEREGLGVWGELGVNVRLRRIALELAPRGEVAALDRATWYAWVGPQWRWR